MKERPIICRDDEVRAFIEGRKTQLRRPIKPIFSDVFPGVPLFKVDGGIHVRLDDETFARRSALIKWCPFGIVGDRLWARECFTPNHGPESTSPKHCIYRADDNRSIEDLSEVRWTPSSQMPRWASRITLEIANVRVERLQDITEEDARAEGVPPFFKRYSSISQDQRLNTGELCADAPYRAAFAVMWDESCGNKDRLLWIRNPFVWVVTVKPEVSHGR